MIYTFTGAMVGAAIGYFYNNVYTKRRGTNFDEFARFLIILTTSVIGASIELLDTKLFPSIAHFFWIFNLLTILAGLLVGGILMGIFSYSMTKACGMESKSGGGPSGPVFIVITGTFIGMFIGVGYVLWKIYYGITIDPR